MPNLRVGKNWYVLSGSDAEVVLGYAIGRAFVKLQQLEFGIISFLNMLSGGTNDPATGFDIFASKTFGNLVREMRRHTFLVALADEMQTTKAKRDFFIHKFLFHRYGGELMTTDEEYELLIQEAHELGALFGNAKTRFQDFMIDRSSIEMFAVKLDPHTGEIDIRESDAIKARRS
ncbi:MAG TPA: hypothetical protein VHB27_18970 [Rhodopila sp.]|uniref:hypothetical protein n=1 Tax=Rhodopila sp. TaxID=2480087 RepID=UPI002BC8A13A|nr:hypothetical protein [Rhodopila sp.]HVY17313.1 hypothetical protein [Rhodopila sp.]